MNKVQIFPERTDKIKALSKLSSFTAGDGTTLYSLTVEMENGDVINFYHPSEKAANRFKVGSTITYEMRKTKEGDKVTNKFENYSFSDKDPGEVTKSVALLPFLRGEKIEDLVFIDIETVRWAKTLTTKNFLYKSWEYKRRWDDDLNAKDLKESYNEKAPLFAEFGKIVCISVGSLRDGKFRKKSYSGDDEKKLLEEFSYDISRRMKATPKARLCGHSIIGFDIPYIYKRLLINRLPVPSLFEVAFKKPWVLEEKYLDIARMWDGPSYHRASLLNITTALGIPSPKDNLDGSMVSDAYYKGKLEDIVTYCEKDILAVANVMNIMFGNEIIPDE